MDAEMSGLFEELMRLLEQRDRIEAKLTLVRAALLEAYEKREPSRPNDLDHEGSQDERGAWCCGAHEHIADMRAENGEEIHPAFRIMLEESTPQEDA
jgi:hypothetical protein